MKYICINNEYLGRKYNLTIGKIYSTVNLNFGNFIKDDNGLPGIYGQNFIKPLNEYRKERISKLLEKL